MRFARAALLIATVSCAQPQRNDTARTAAEPPPAAQSRETPSTPSTPIAVEAGTARQELSDEDRALIDEDRRVKDKEHLVGTRKQVPLRNWKPPREGGPFPYGRVATVRGYSFDLGGFEELAFLTGGGFLRGDGTFGPAVSFPGALLSEAQQSALLGLVRTHGAATHEVRTRCEFDPHHGFVFFDRDERPIAELEVCLTCGQWVTLPGPLSGQSFDTEPIRALCRELGLGGCWLGDARVGTRIGELYARGLLTPRESEDEVFAELGFDPARPLGSLTAPEKDLLCRWGRDRSSEWAARAWGGTPDNEGAYGFSFPGPPEVRLIFEGQKRCVSTFPGCDSSLAEVARCYIARFPPTKREAMPPSAPAIPVGCENVRSCLWGIDESSVAPADAGARE